MWEWVQFPITFWGHSHQLDRCLPSFPGHHINGMGSGNETSVILLPIQHWTCRHHSHTEIEQLTTYTAMVTGPTHLFLPYLRRCWCNPECTGMSIRIHSHSQRVPAAWAQAQWSIQESVGMIYWDILCLDTKNTNKNTNVYIVHPHTHIHTW